MIQTRHGIRSVTFEVLGEPKPQGSGKLITVGQHRRTIKKQDAGFARWRNAVAEAGVRAMADDEWMPALYACRLEVDFVFRPPKSRPKWHGVLNEPWKFNGSDLDKLVRAVGDGLTISRIVDDDRLIAELIARKRYAASESEAERAVITVTELFDRDQGVVKQ